MKILLCFLIFCLLLSTVDAQITISADKSLPRDGETINLICSIPSFIVPATWSVNTNGVSLTVCRPSGPCVPPNDAARYTYSATASSISVTITSFNSNIDTFGWRCQYGTNSAVYVIKPADAQITISADKSLPRDGETVNLICSIPSFIVPATWSVSNTSVGLTGCRPSGPCQPPNDAARYNYSATASSISVTIISFNSMQDTFGWRCQYDTHSAVYVIKPAVPVTTVQLTKASGETLTSTINVVRGGITDIRCSTAPNGSRPRAMFRWYNRSVNQSPVLIGNQSISSTPDAIMIPGRPESDILISYSTLTLTGNASYHNMYIFCEARDEISTGNFTQSGMVHINVVYPPVVQLFPNYSVYDMTEGTQNFVFTCNIFEANPLPQTHGYSWFHKSIVIQGQTSSIYTLASVQRSDDGDYICTAKNEYGNGTSNALSLNVQYGAKIVNLTTTLDSNTVNENSSVSFHCHVDSNPLPTITWTREDNNTVLMTESGVLQSQFRIVSAQCLDMGKYSCTAYNGIGTPVTEILQLFVKCHPRTYFRFPQETKVYQQSHTAAVLRYTVISYPLPTFTWTIIWNGSESRDLPGSASQHDDGHQSELRFTSLDIDNFGYYSVTANNSVYPTAKEVFEIIPAASSLDIGASFGMGFGGIFLGVVGTISVTIIRKRITGTLKYSSASSRAPAPYPELKS